MTLSAQALTTVGRLEGALGLSSTGTTLEPFIEGASEYLQDELEYELYFVEDKVASGRVVGREGRELRVISHTPIASVSQVTDDGEVVDPTSYAIAQGGLAILRTQGAWLRRPNNWAPFGDPIGGPADDRFLVTYTGGYVTPAQVELDGTLTRTLPYMFEQAVVDAAVALYRGQGRDQSIRSKQVSRGSITYGDLQQIQSVQSVLKRHRRIGVA